MGRLNLYARDYVVFDLETTGFSPVKDEIIEISGIRVRGGQAAGEFSSLVNPMRPIPAAAMQVNGITDEMVKDAPELGSVLGEFLDFIGSDILVGHNIHSFDMKFLEAGAARELQRKVENDYVDTLYLARTLLPLSHFRLTDVAEYFHVETAGAHRALNDCVMNQLCYEKMREVWEQRGGKDSGTAEAAVCPKCGSLLVQRKGKFGDFLGCSGFPMCRYTRNV